MKHAVEGVVQDLRLALRGVVRAPGFALVAVATLGICIGSSATMFSVVNGVMLQPLPYPDPERLVMIFNRYPTLGIERGGQSPGDFQDYQDQADAFESIGAFGGTHTQTLTGVGRPARVATSSATDNLFPMLGVRPAAGRLFEPTDDDSHVLISHGFWQGRFGGAEDVLGRSFILSDQPKTVIGVLPRDFALHAPRHLGLPTDIGVWIPIRRFLGSPGAPDRTAHWMTVVARLAPGVPLDEARHQLDAVAAWQRRTFPVRAERDAQIDVVSLHEEIVTEVRPTLFALLGAVCFVLLIGCANIANLLLARGQGRLREMRLRHALGATSGRLVQQLLTEGALLAGLGAVVGMVVAFFGVDLVLALRPDNLPLAGAVGVDGDVLAFSCLVAAGATVVFGLAPALTLSRASLAGPRAGAGGSRRSSRVRSGLVVVELALSVVLLTGAGLMMRSVSALGQVWPGYGTEAILTFVAGPPQEAWQGESGRLNPALQEFYRRTQESIARLPGVEAVGTIWPTPLGGSDEGYSTYTSRETIVDGHTHLASSQLVTPGYFETMGIPILAGRALRLDDGADKLVVDERMARKLWPDQDPIGRRLEIGWWSGPVWGEVVGVAASVRTIDLRRPDPETVYRKAAAFAYSPSTFVVRAQGDLGSLAESIRQTVNGLYPDVALEQMRPLLSYEDEQMAQTRFVMTLISLFAAAAVFFAALGLYGVISFLVGQRTQEMGIRIALGARSGQVFRLVMLQGLALAALGLVLGLGGAWATTRLVTAHLFGVAPSDPATLVAVATLLAVVAVLAAARPAWRASRVDPMTTLRSE